MQVTINDLQAGKAGEYMVCADLIINGYVAFPSEQGLHYDVVLDFSGRLIRIQVKTTRGPRKLTQRVAELNGYIFHIQRMGKGGIKTYDINEIDLFALVALDTRTIGYIPSLKAKRTMVFRCEDSRGLHQNEVSQDQRNMILQLRDSGLTFRQIGSRLGKDSSHIYRVCVGKQLPRDQGRYLSDLSLEEALKCL